MFARIYTRVSTEEQAASGFSLAAQMERLEAFCLSQGWAIAGRYADEGVSAKDLARPEFQRLMAEVGRGEVVLVHKLDRLTRSVRDLDDLMRVFEQRGVLFRSATEQFDTTTATGRLFIRMVAEMAQWERETIAERASFGKQQKAQSGDWPGGPPPIGYLTAPSDKIKAGRRLLRLVPDPRYRHIVPMIFERYLVGHGIRGVSIWLNDELGVRTPKGNRFHRLTISRMLSNPVYCGDIEHGRAGGQLKARIPGGHEALISREVFEAVQALGAVRRTGAPRQATGMYPLSGIAKCGVCGGRIDGHRRREGDGRVYRCHNYMIGAGCGGARTRSLAAVAAHLAEEHLVGEIQRLIRDPAHLPGLLAEFEMRAAIQDGLTQAEVSRMVHDSAEAEAAVSRWKRLFERGKIEDDEYLEAVRPHRDRLRALRERLAEYRRRPSGQPVREGPGRFAIDFRASWEGLESRERKVLLQNFVEAYRVEIVIFPDRRVELRPMN